MKQKGKLSRYPARQLSCPVSKEGCSGIAWGDGGWRRGRKRELTGCPAMFWEGGTASGECYLELGSVSFRSAGKARRIASKARLRVAPRIFFHSD